MTVTEGNTRAVNANFNVTLSAASNLTVTVQFETADGTAVAPGDYVAKTGTLTFTPGQTSKTVPVAVRGNTVPEGMETFKVNLLNQTNAALADSQGIGTINDDD